MYIYKFNEQIFLLAIKINTLRITKMKDTIYSIIHFSFSFFFFFFFVCLFYINKNYFYIVIGNINKYNTLVIRPISISAFFFQ